MKQQFTGSFEQKMEGAVGVQGGEMRGAGARGDCALRESIPSSSDGSSGQKLGREAFNRSKDLYLVAAADQAGNGVGGGGRGGGGLGGSERGGFASRAALAAGVGVTTSVVAAAAATAGASWDLSTRV